jgi:hypothetical protein
VKRPARQLVKDLEALGFDHIWTNSSGAQCYAHPDDPQQEELSVSPNTHETGAKNVLRRARRIAGADTVVEKRNATQVRERATAARQRLQYVRERHGRLLTTRADPAQVAAAARLVEQREHELDAVERLMRQPPAGGHAHRGTGQARHYSGPRA